MMWSIKADVFFTYMGRSVFAMHAPCATEENVCA